MQGVLLCVLLVLGVHAVCGGWSTLLTKLDAFDAIKYIKKFIASTSLGDGNKRSQMSTGDIITLHGYPQENYTVLTPDGYCLTVFRIRNPGMPAVVVLHGIQSSSSDFVVLGPNQDALAYTLYDAGFDVWLANQRGNFFGTCNVNMSQESDEFWRFSFHEIGAIDMAATVDFILEKTGQSKLAFIAHSQGTTAFFALASTRPEYNDKIHTMVALGPVAYLDHLISVPLKTIVQNYELTQTILGFFGIDELSFNTPTRGLVSTFCNIPGIPQFLCTNLLMSFGGGYDLEHFNKSLLGDILAHAPSGGSVQQIKHYGQIYKTGRFCQYDYGQKNPQYYNGSSTAPCYNLSQITTRVNLYYGLNDQVAVKEDVLRLEKLLANAVLRELSYEKYNHIDYLWGLYNRKLVFNDVIDRLYEGVKNATAT